MKSSPKKSQSTEQYLPVMDWWVSVCTFCVLGILVAMLPSVILSGVPLWQSIPIVFVIALLILTLVDSAFFTSYWLEESNLRISSQLREFCLPYRSMRTIQSSGLRGLFTFGNRKRFSFSLTGYDIFLEGQSWKVISLSPRDRDQFISQLLSRIDAERSRRVTVDA